MKKILIGQKYETLGGWDAVVIHVRFDGQGFYAIHKHESEEESVPIFHRMDGTSTTALAVNERPCYGKHPADIILE